MWNIYIDRSARIDHQGVGFTLKSPSGVEFAYALKYDFHVCNNESEYESLLVGLRMALAMKMDQLIVHGDSQIAYRHITGMFEAKKDNMKKYLY